MPEGPTISLLRDSASILDNQQIENANGKSKDLDFLKLKKKTITGFRTWGKHLLILFPDGYLDTHLMLFGSCLINKRKNAIPTLHLELENGEINFYASRISAHSGSPEENYDFTADVLNENYDRDSAVIKMKNKPTELICDVLLDQHIFSGVGNKLKDEILFKAKVHPQSRTSGVPDKKKKEMATDAAMLSKSFLGWIQEETLTEHMLAHAQKNCPRDHIPFQKVVLGKTKRSAWFCDICQKLYS